MKLDELKRITLEKTGVDLTSKSRNGNVIYIKQCYIYMARINKYSYAKIGESIGLTHATVLWHFNQADFWVKNSDREFIAKIYEIYDVDVRVVIDPRDLLLPIHLAVSKCPLDRVDELAERVEAIIKGYLWQDEARKKNTFTKAKSVLLGTEEKSKKNIEYVW